MIMKRKRVRRGNGKLFQDGGCCSFVVVSSFEWFEISKIDDFSDAGLGVETGLLGN